MWDEMVGYLGKLWCPIMVEKAVLPLLYSAINVKFTPFEGPHSTRYRLNVMLQWESGWLKSTILNKIRSFFPFRAHLLTSSSAGALRGSFNDGKFYLPELLINDVLVVPEFVELLQDDKVLAKEFLNALEDAEVRCGLVKGGKVGDKEKKRIEECGGKFEDERLSYRSYCTIWSGTHTLDGITERSREALISRFHVVSIQPFEIPNDLAWKDPAELTDKDFELEIRAWLTKIYKNAAVPDVEFANDVVKKIKGEYLNERKHPREVGNLRRMAVAHKELFPEMGVVESANFLKRFFNVYAGLPSKEILASYIFNNPKTFNEIQTFTGLEKSNIFYHFKRLGVKTQNCNPKRYYLDSIPEASPHADTQSKSVKTMREVQQRKEAKT